MSGVQMSVTGLKQLTDKLRSNMPKARQAVKAELYQFSEEVMAASKEIVPVGGVPESKQGLKGKRAFLETGVGALMNSGKVMPPVEEGNSISVTMGYGDESAPYALYVHEALEGPHAINPDWSWAKAAAKGNPIHWTRPGSGPRYLARPLEERQDKLPGRLKDVFTTALKS